MPNWTVKLGYMTKIFTSVGNKNISLCRELNIVVQPTVEALLYIVIVNR